MGIMSESEVIHDLTLTGIEIDDSKPSSHEASISIEKGHIIERTVTEQSEHHLDAFSHEDPFPIAPGEEEEIQQFTVRAVLVGCLLGAVISASNVYLGLKTGWTFGASLFGSIFGFAILKPLSRALPAKFGGGYFGPKENVCCQSAATAAGSLGLLFTSGFPAAYQLGLLGKTPADDFAKLITFTACCAYYGMFFAIPLRKFYILKQKLTFPSAVSTITLLRIGIY